MKQLFFTLTLSLAAMTVWANDNSVQQQAPLPLANDNGLQMQQVNPENTAQQATPEPAVTPAMQQWLMQQAERLAAQQAEPASTGNNTRQQSNVQRLQ